MAEQVSIIACGQYLIPLPSRSDRSAVAWSCVRELSSLTYGMVATKPQGKSEATYVVSLGSWGADEKFVTVK